MLMLKVESKMMIATPAFRSFLPALAERGSEFCFVVVLIMGPGQNSPCLQPCPSSLAEKLQAFDNRP
jgi:hypothetical protein